MELRNPETLEGPRKRLSVFRRGTIPSIQEGLQVQVDSTLRSRGPSKFAACSSEALLSASKGQGLDVLQTLCEKNLGS